MAAACSGSAGRSRAPAPDQAATTIRFAIEVREATVGPLYVLVSGADDQPGWVSASRDGERIWFRERCDIEDCSAPAAVCGAAIPMVRALAMPGAPRRIELVWDGSTSEIAPVERCETRRPAAPGGYVARFCYAREAAFDGAGSGGPGRDRPGRLVRPTCVEQPFTRRDRDVVVRP